jgi:butyrate kinase
MDVIGLLTLNPGSTSTKIAVFHSSSPVYVKTIRHSSEELKPFEKITDQFQFRKDVILNQLRDADIKLDVIKAVVGRGGLLKPIPGGVYEVNDAMKRDLFHSPIGEHASNLGGLIAADLAAEIPGARAFIADPVVVDEMEEIARYSGHPLFRRISIFHALNQKAIARKHAASIQRKYEDLNLILVHLGGGISISAHCKGRVIDTNQALDGDGPFSPERSGTLPVGDLVRVCFSGKYTQKEVMKMIKGEGGLVAYTGTNNAYDVEIRAENGDQVSKDAFEAMAYQVCKEIGAMYAVLKGDVDAILITGGIANSKWFINEILNRVEKIAPTHIYPGEDEMEALALNGLRVLNGECEPLIYQ